jgi:hypothetical protein
MSKLCLDDIANKTSNEFNILLTARNVLIKKVSHKIKNKVVIPINIIVKDINE